MGKRVRSNWAASLLLMALGLATALGLGTARASFIPTDISGIEAWFDASQGVAVSGGVVQSWADLSAKGHSASLANGAPVLATGQINGLPAVQFRGNDDWLNLSGGFFGKEIYMVWKSPSAAFSNYGGILGAQGGRGSTFIVENNNTVMHGNQYPNLVSRNGTALPSPFNMAPVTDYMVMKVTVNDGDTNPARTFHLGRVDGWSFNIDLAAAIAYNRTLTTQEENSVGFYLASRYGIKTTYFPPAASLTLTWKDGAADNWGSANWNPGPVVWPNNDSTKAVVGGVSLLTNATVEKNTIAHSLNLSGTGKVTVGSGNTLTLLTSVASSGGTLALTDASTLRTVYPNGEPTGSNVLTNLSVSGKASIEVQTGTLTVDNTTMASGLTTTGAGKVELKSVSADPGSFFDVRKGTLTAKYPDYLSKADLVLSGGTFQVTGPATVVPGTLKERLFDNDAAAYIDPIDSGSGYLTRGAWPGDPQGYVYEGSFTMPLAFNGDHWQNAPGNFDAKGLNGWDNIGGVWYGRMTLGGASPLPGGSDITLATGSDDGSVFWVDKDKNGVFSHTGALGDELVVNNNYYQGTTWRGGLLNLPADTYNVAIGFYEGGGGEYMEARYAVGNTIGNWGAMTTVQPGAAGQTNIWSAAGYGAIDMSSTNILVAPGTTGSRISSISDAQTTFGTLTFGASSDLTVAGAPTTFTNVLTNGNSSLGVETLVTLGGYDDQGVANSTMRIYGTKTLSIEGATIGSVVARSTNFQVDLGATLQVAGRDLLGGDPLVTLNGGTFTVKPSTASPMYPNAYMMATDVSVIASSTVKADTTGTVALGNLWLQKPVTLTTSGPGTLAFLDIELRAAGTSTLNATTRTLGGSLLAGGLATTLIQKGGSDLLFYHPGSGLAGTTIQVESGRLGLVGAATVTGANLQMTGGNLVLGSPDGSNQTYANAITSTASGTLTAGASGIGVAKGDIILNSLTPGAGTTVELKTEGSHRIVLPKDIKAPGSLTISQGNVQIGSVSTPLDLELANLTVAGGTTTVSASSGTAKLTNGLLGGGTLATEGTFTINPQASLGLGGQLRVDSGNLTLNVPAGGSLPSGRALHLDASALLGYSNGQTVTNWTDVSGAVHDANVLTSDPAYTTGVLNGLPVVRFDNDDRLATTYNFDPLTNYTVLSVARYTGGDSERIISSGTRNWLFGFHGDGIERWHAEGWIYNNQVAGGNTDWQLHAGTMGPATNNPTASFWRNGALLTSGNQGSGDNNYMIGTLQLNGYQGGNEVSNADIAEVIIFDRVLTPSELNSVGGYLATKYGLTTSYTGSLAASIGDVRLADGASLTLAGAGQPKVASIGATANGPIATGPMTLSNFGSPTAERTADTVALDATINTTGFNVTGPGTIALKQGLTVASSLTVAKGSALATQANLTIDAKTASVNVTGDLNITSGILTINLPAGGTFPSGLLYRLDAGVGVTADGSGYVSLWADQSLAGNNFSGSAGSQPLLVSGALNGLPVVRFDGTDDQLNLGTATSPQTVLIVNKSNTQGNLQGIWGWLNNDKGIRMAGSPAWSTPGDGNDFVNPQGLMYVNGVQTGSFGSLGTAHVLAAIRGTASPTTYSSTQLGWYFGGRVFQGDIAEVLVFDRQLTTDEMNNVGGYLAGKYGITSSYTGGLAPSLGHVNMSPGTQLILGDKDGVAGAGSANFASISAADGAIIQGYVTLTGDVAPGKSLGTLNVTGGFTMGGGSTYHWEHDGTASDLIAVTGSPGDLNLASPWNLGISLGKVIPSATYDLFTYTGTLSSGGVMTPLKENAYAKLITSAKLDTSVVGKVGVNLTLAEVSTWTSRSDAGGTIDWYEPTNWNSGTGPRPDGTRGAIVQASGIPEAFKQIATVTPVKLGEDPRSARNLIVDNGGHVLIQQGATLTVVDSTDVLPTGSLTVHGTLTMPTTPKVTWSSAENFNASNGGFTTSTLNPVTPPDQPGPWTWGAGGVGGTNGWSTPGGETLGYPTPPPYEQWLTSPVYTVGGTGSMALSFEHLYNFEKDWDGGVVMMSLNGKAFTQVPASAFTQYGYSGTCQTSDPWGFPEQLNGLPVFDGSSGTFLTSIANLGWLTAGTTLQLQFRGGWDWYSTGGSPGWTVDNLQLTQTVAGGTGTLTTAGTTTFGPNAILDLKLIHVIGGTTTGQMTPGEMTTLGSGTTLKVSGGTVAGGFSSTNTSKTPGSYAFEVEGGTVNAHLYASTASLRRSGSGAAALNGAITLDTMSIESGSTTLGDAPDLIVNTLSMTGGSLAINRYSQIGKLALTAGTLIPSYRTINVSEAFTGSGTVSVNQNAAINLGAKASVNFGGTLEVNNGILFVTVPSGAVTPPELLSGLIGHWAFDEGAGTTATDLSGKGNNGAVNNATWVAGKSGSALSFNGTNSSVNTTVSLLNGVSAFTMAGWVKATAGGGRIGLFGQNDLVEAGFDNQLAVWSSTAGGNVTAAYPEAGSFPWVNWHHIAYVGDSSGLRIFVDGTQVASGGGAQAAASSGYLFKIGGDGIWDGGGNWFNGLIDDVAAWSRALPAADIKTLMSVGFGGGAYLGNLKLAPGTEARISGGSAGFASVVATGGPSLLNPLTIAPGSIKASNPTLTFTSAVESSNFSITGAGTVLLLDKLTVAKGGTLSVPTGTTLASQGKVSIEAASAATIGITGDLNIQSGSLTFAVPGGKVPSGLAPAAYYSFDKVSGTTVTNDGTLGTAKNAFLWNGATITAGKFGSGLRTVDGSGQYLNVDPNGSIDIGNDWTIASWYQDLCGPDNWRTLTRGNANDHQVMVVDNATNQLGTYANGRGDWRAGTPTYAVPTSGWHHIAGVGHTAGATEYIDLYVDGVWVTRTDRSSTTQVSWIGDGQGWSQTFANVLDDFVVYNRGLSAGEVASLFKNGPSLGLVPRYLGNLVMAPKTELILTDGKDPVGAGAATFTSIKSGDGAKIHGPDKVPGPGWLPVEVAVDGLLDPTGELDITGDLLVVSGSTYKWDIATDIRDLVVSDTLHLGKSFTLELFAAGGSIMPDDGPIPIFKFSSTAGLFINDIAWNPVTNPLQYLIDVGNLADPFNQYVWDASEARLEVLTADPGIYLVDLKARAIPEPTTLTLLALGGLGLLSRRRRRAGRRA